MTFHYLLMAGHSIYLKQLMAELGDTGLTSGQPKVLDYLMDHDGTNQKKIADACHIEAATLTSVLNGMEAKGLIERRRLDGNRRSFYVYLTESGRVMGQRVTETFLKLEHETFLGIPDSEKTEFMEMFGKLYKRMERQIINKEKE